MPPPEYLSSSVEVFRRSSVQESLNSIHVTCGIASVAETHGNAQMLPPRTIAPGMVNSRVGTLCACGLFCSFLPPNFHPHVCVLIAAESFSTLWRFLIRIALPLLFFRGGTVCFMVFRFLPGPLLLGIRLGQLFLLRLVLRLRPLLRNLFRKKVL